MFDLGLALANSLWIFAVMLSVSLLLAYGERRLRRQHARVGVRGVNLLAIGLASSGVLVGVWSLIQAVQAGSFSSRTISSGFGICLVAANIACVQAFLYPRSDRGAGEAGGITPIPSLLAFVVGANFYALLGTTGLAVKISEEARAGPRAVFMAEAPVNWNQFSVLLAVAVAWLMCVLLVLRMRQRVLLRERRMIPVLGKLILLWLLFILVIIVSPLRIDTSDEELTLTLAAMDFSRNLMLLLLAWSEVRLVRCIDWRYPGTVAANPAGAAANA